MTTGLNTYKPKYEKIIDEITHPQYNDNNNVYEVVDDQSLAYWLSNRKSGDPHTKEVVKNFKIVHINKGVFSYYSSNLIKLYEIGTELVYGDGPLASELIIGGTSLIGNGIMGSDRNYAPNKFIAGLRDLSISANGNSEISSGRGIMYFKGVSNCFIKGGISHCDYVYNCEIVSTKNDDGVVYGCNFVTNCYIDASNAKGGICDSWNIIGCRISGAEAGTKRYCFEGCSNVFMCYGLNGECRNSKNNETYIGFSPEGGWNYVKSKELN